METAGIEKLRYPIGKFKIPQTFTDADLATYINNIEALPDLVAREMATVSEADLKLHYRPGSWNILQLINHLVDSHMNAVIRFKLGLTEALPTIKPYDENQWVKLEDTTNCSVDLTLHLLKTLHQRWVILLRSIKPEDWSRKVYHPESKREWSLSEFAALYSWHGLHHVAHIQLAKQNK